MKCNKFMWWAFGANSWACKKLGICLCDPKPDPPDPEYIIVTICESSGLLATGCCKKAGAAIDKRFKIGEEPIERCDFPGHGIIKQQICKTSGLIPNTPYCGNAGTVEQIKMCRFQKPTKKCTIHKKPIPPEIAKIPEDMTVKAMKQKFGHPIIISQYLIPSFLIEKAPSFDEEFIEKNLVNRVASEVHANAARVFSFGGWEPETLKMIIYPFAKNVGGKFKLGSKDPKYLDQISRRISWNAERRISTIVTLTDNCSTHQNRPGFWNAHPWNGGKNANHTSNWKPSIYHFYEPEHQGKPGMKESAKWIEEFIRWVVSKLEQRFDRYLMWEICNEGQAGFYYHDMIRKWMSEEGAKDDWKILTSLDHGYEDSYKKDMNLFLNYAAHGIQTSSQYNEKKALFKSGVRFLPSEDGLQPKATFSDYKELIPEILNDGNLGFESNSRPYFYSRSYEAWINDPATWSRMKAISDGWKTFLNSR